MSAIDVIPVGLRQPVIGVYAQKILNMYPAPNANGGKTYSNLVENVSKTDNTIQWDQRLDWNISPKDQTYARYSYLHDIILNALPLGPTLDVQPGRNRYPIWIRPSVVAST